MKKILLVLLTFYTFSVLGQIGPPGLSIGADKVLFEKGIIDKDLLGEIIAEKQAELKKELTKRLLLNKHLSNGPYTTYNYASQVLDAILNHKDKSVIKKQLLESSTELAVILGIAEAYLKLDKKAAEEIIYEFQLFLLSQGVQAAPTELSDFERNQNRNLVRKIDLASKGKFLTKISELYKLKDLGRYEPDSSTFSTYLQHIILDMVAEICRENESLQQLGFFQKQFDQTAFKHRSHYRRFIKLNKGAKITVLLDQMYEKLDETIDLNLKYSSIILNQPRRVGEALYVAVADKSKLLFEDLKKMNIDTLSLNQADTLAISRLSRIIYGDEITSRLSKHTIGKQKAIEKMAKDVFDNVLALDLSVTSEKDVEILNRLSALAYFGKNTLNIHDDKREYDVWVNAVKSLNTELIGMNIRLGNRLSGIIKSLDDLSNNISNYQYEVVQTKISELQGKYIDGIDDNLAALFEVLSNLDKATSYDQVAKLIVSSGDIFFDLSKSRVFNNLANLQAYMIVDTDSNRVDIQVEDMILYLGDKYINRTSGNISLYFTLGYNYTFSGNDTLNNFSYAAEKIGIKVKLFDFNKYRTYDTRYYIPKQKPIVNDIYLLGYASGLLYQIEQLKTEADAGGSIFGILFGMHFFNGLDFSMGPSSVQLNDNRSWVFTTAFDIPITEYLGRLSKKMKK